MLNKSGTSIIASITLLLLTGCNDVIPKYVFDMTRIAADGSVYKGNNNFQEQPWACVLDNKFGLTWEVKTASPGLHNGANTYSWYERDPFLKVYEGSQNSGACTGSGCDTEAFVAAVNAENLCGYSDWRIPSKADLGTILDAAARFPGPTVPKDFLPNVNNSKIGYWTSSPFEKHKSGTWAWRFDHGIDFVALKKEIHYLMLVRGTAPTLEDQEKAQKEQEKAQNNPVKPQ